MGGFAGLKAGTAVRGAGLGAALAAAVVLVFLAAASSAGAGSALVSAAPAAAPAAQLGATPAPGSIVVVRRSAGHDSLWSVDPAAGTPTELVALTFRPARVEQPAGGRRLAYLPLFPGPKVYVYDTQTGRLHAWSLAARGVKVVDSFAWLSSTKLVVAGGGDNPSASFPSSDRLYLLNAATGASRRYGNLSGTEPTVAPAKRMVFVRLSDGGLVRGGDPARRWAIERLYSLRLAAGARPRLIRSAKYEITFHVVVAERYFRDPRLSRDGTYLITSTADGDHCRYAVRAAATGKALKTIATTLVGREATAWSSAGDQVAFWGMPAYPGGTTVLYVYHVATHTLSTSAELSNVAVRGLGWSSADALLACSVGGLDGNAAVADTAELWTSDPASLASPTDLGPGGLPVFMP